jgi:hypothetical protein
MWDSNMIAKLPERERNEKFRIFRGDVEYVSTSVAIPKELRDKAKSMRISFADALIDGLKIHFKEIERKVGDEAND